MEIENNLNQFKKDYLKFGPPEGSISNGWLNLSPKLHQSQAQPAPAYLGFARVTFASLAVLIISVTVLIALAQKSLPGQPLYEFKLAGEELVSPINLDEQVLVQRRGQEIIDIVKKQQDQSSLDQAQEEYKKAIIKSQESANSQSQTQAFQKTLKNQEDSFKQILRDNPNNIRLRQILELNQQAQKGQVKGIRKQTTETNGLKGESADHNSQNQLNQKHPGGDD